MTISITETAANAEVEAIATLFNLGTLDLRSGTPPVNADAAVTGTLLCTIQLLSTAFIGNAVGGSMALDVLLVEGTVVADGTITWGRFYQSDGTTAILDCTVAETGGDLLIDVELVTIDDIVKIISFSITCPTT